MEPRKTPNCSTVKRLHCANNEGEEDETGSKIAPIYQETQSKEAAACDNKTFLKNY